MSVLRDVLDTLKSGRELFSWVVGLGLDVGARMPLAAAVAVVVALGMVEIGIAYGLQRSFVALIKAQVEKGDAGPSTWRKALELEIAWSPFFLFLIPVWVMRAITLLSARRALSRKKAAESDGPEKGEGTPKPSDVTPSYLIVTLGPTYLLGAIVATTSIAVAWIVEPIIRLQMGLGSGQAVYDTVLLGWLRPAALFLPLSQHYPMALVACAALFLCIASTTARLIRLGLRDTIHKNLFLEQRQSDLLPFWSRWAGARPLHALSASFGQWGFWVGVAVVALTLLGLAFGRQPPYQVPPYLLGTAFVGTTGWIIHLLLRGELFEREEPKSEETTVAKTQKGWPDVLAALAKRHGGLLPLPHVERPRAIATLALAGSEAANVASGLSELLPTGTGEKRGLTEMQRDVLARLAKISRHERVEISSGGALALEASIAVSSDDDKPGLVVIAPEGTGRTTLALLAAVDHVVSCARSVIVVTPTAAASEAFHRRAREALETSTLRWNVRVRRSGDDLGEDVVKGVTPDVIITDLQHLLDDLLTRDDLLSTVGLLIVDDADEVVGAPECHARLTFRRVFVRIRALRSARNGAADVDTKVLVLSGDGMHDAETWLTGLVSGVRYTPPMRYESLAEVAAELPPAVEFEDAEVPSHDAVAGEAPGGAVQVFHDLSGLRPDRSGAEASRRTRLRVTDLIDACESEGVSWHYRRARDGERADGRRSLYLRSEPQHCAPDPEDAAVVILEGAMAGVLREQGRLVRAGARAAQKLATPVTAIVRVVDPDEARVFDSRDVGPAADEGERDEGATPQQAIGALLATFPRPTVSHPVGLVRDRHVSAELSAHPLEVAEIAEIFGNEPLGRLRALARSGDVTVEIHRDIAGSGFSDRVRLGLQARAILGEERAVADASSDYFPPPPRSVFEASLRSVLVQDGSNAATQWYEDAGTAHRRFYPHCIFENDQGRFEVFGRVSERGRGIAPGASPILVGPHLREEISMPRRRTWIRRRGAAAGTLGGLEASARKRVILGRSAVEIEACNIDCETEHVATLHLSPDGRAVKNRMIFEKASPDRLRGSFQTAGLFVYPEPDAGRDDGRRLDRDGVRLLAAVLRVLLRSAYRCGDRAVEVALQFDSAGELAPSSDPSGVRLVRADAPFDHRATRVGVEDAIVFLDAQEGGNGATRAIARDGVGPLLLGAWAYLKNSGSAEGQEDTRWRWWLLYDDSAPDDEDDLAQLEQVGEAAAREYWDRVAPLVEAWLAERVATKGGERRQASGEPASPLRLVPDSAGEAYRRYALFDPDAVKASWNAVFGSALPEGPVDWKVGDLDRIFEWMHANIAYERGVVTYDKKERIATVSEVLNDRRGDCVDMAALFASFAHHIGARARVVLIPGHALCQVALGDRSPENVVDEILALSARRARRVGLAPHQHPNFQARTAEGWRQTGDPTSRFERTGEPMGYFEWRGVSVEITTDPDGSRWLCVDEARSRVLGRVDTYQQGVQGALRDDGAWKPGTRFIEYGTAEGEMTVLVATVDGSGEAKTSAAPKTALPPRPRVPSNDRATRVPRREDLGHATPESVPQAALVWRRHRWTFGNDRARRREYVLDIACAEEWLAEVRPPVRIVMPSLTPSDRVPPRVLERARQAVEAIELTRPSLDALCVVLRDLLTRSRRDEDSEADERERAFDLVHRLVHGDALRPYVGDARDRVQAVALALATGTADTWGRTLLQAELQRALIEKTTLTFDHRGWPSLERDGPEIQVTSAGRWTLVLEMARSKS